MTKRFFLKINNKCSKKKLIKIVFLKLISEFSVRI